MIKLGFLVIDLHPHLRNNIPLHTKIAKENGIDIVRYCKAIPVSAITKNLAGKKLVEIDKIKPYVAEFSDDGKYLKEDVLTVKEGLADGTIDVIGSDYAPFPRRTGIADFSSFLPL